MQVDLFNGEPPASRPAWRVIEAARNQHLTGELALPSDPPTNVYLINGEVYFAERTTDGGIGVRLLVEGVITRKQMSKGSVMVSGAEHLGRLFERDETIDRHAVELCVELMTDDVLTSVSNEQVDSYVMTLYKRHTSGIDRWLPNHSTADAPPVNEAQREAAFSDMQPPVLNGTAVPHPVVADPVVPDPVVPQQVVPQQVVPQLVVAQEGVPEPILPEPTLPAPVCEPATVQPVAAAVLPTLAPISAKIAPTAPPTAPEPAPMFTPSPEVVGRAPERLELGEWPTTATEAAPQGATLPQRTVPAADSYPAATPTAAETPAAPSSTIADEVADAVRRALAAIDLVLTPADDSAPQPPRPL